MIKMIENDRPPCGERRNKYTNRLVEKNAKTVRCFVRFLSSLESDARARAHATVDANSARAINWIAVGKLVSR